MNSTYPIYPILIPNTLYVKNYFTGIPRGPKNDIQKLFHVGFVIGVSATRSWEKSRKRYLFNIPYIYTMYKQTFICIFTSSCQNLLGQEDLIKLFVAMMYPFVISILHFIISNQLCRPR